MVEKIKNRKGFTLIELIVVIAIIAILAAVLIPRFTGFSDSAREKSAISDARNILISMQALIAQGETGITQTDVYDYSGKTFDGNIAWATADTDTFTYTILFGTQSYAVGVNAGEIDTTFNNTAPEGTAAGTQHSTRP
jgi:type IV pilus assembly protein PilA